jgi:hypothetical protein
LAGNSILVFSKTNGFRHGEAIEVSVPAFEKMAGDNGWSFIPQTTELFLTPGNCRNLMWSYGTIQR